MSLVKAKGNDVLPSVKDIVATAKSAMEAGNFSKVTTNKDEEFYYLTDSEADIDANPDKYVVRHSAKHGANFIVPIQSSGFTKF